MPKVKVSVGKRVVLSSDEIAFSGTPESVVLTGLSRSKKKYRVELDLHEFHKAYEVWRMMLINKKRGVA